MLNPVSKYPNLIRFLRVVLLALTPVVGFAQTIQAPTSEQPAQSVPPQSTPGAVAAGPASEAVVKMNEFVVEGISGGLINAIGEKQDSSVILDAISAEGIGSFPDQNIAESLQRISGVQIERDRGEGTQVSVDGLDPKFDLVTYNGRFLTTATGGRNLDFRLFDSTFVESLEVYKTPSADLVEGALSATINIKTLRPIDLGVQRLVINLGEEYEQNSKKWSPNASFIYSNVFGGGRFGISFGASSNERNMETYSFVGYGMDPYAHPGQYLVPNANYYNDDVETRKRENYVASFQFKPSKDFVAYCDLLFAKYKTDDLNYNDALRYDNSPWDGQVVSVGITQVAGQQYATTLNEDHIDYRNNGRDYISDYYTESLGGGFTWNASNLIKITGDASYSFSQQQYSDLGLEIIGGANATYVAPLGSIPTTTFDAGYNPLDPNNFVALSYNGSYKQPTTDKNVDARLDATIDLHWGIFKSLQIGARIADRENEQISNQVDVPATTLASLLNVPLLNTVAGPAISAAPFVGVIQPTNSSFFSGFIPTPWLSFVQSDLFPKVSQTALLNSTAITNELANDFGVKEKTMAEYFRLNFSGKAGDFPVSGNIGLRAVTTSQESSGYAPDLTQIIFSQAGATTSIPNVTAETVSRSYTDVLPSFNSKVDLSKEFVLRFGLARVMSRPDLSLLSTGTAVNANVSSITSNNPSLKPYYADQANLSLEYYFAPGGLLSINGFYKKIDSFITTATVEEPLTVQIDTGGTEVVDFAHSFPANGNGAHLQGVELGYQQQFKFLPNPFNGLGVEANYTLVDAGSVAATNGGPPIVLTGVSKNNYNLVVYYEHRLFNARLAYDYRDGYVTDPLSYFGDGSYTESLGVLDATIHIRLTKNLTLNLDANNLNNAYLKQETLYNVLRLVEDDGRRFAVSLRAEF